MATFAPANYPTFPPRVSRDPREVRPPEDVLDAILRVRPRNHVIADDGEPHPLYEEDE